MDDFIEPDVFKEYTCKHTRVRVFSCRLRAAAIKKLILLGLFIRRVCCSVPAFRGSPEDETLDDR